MAIASPFHERTSQLCNSLRWKDWGGYHAVCRYGAFHDPEYFAFRQSTGMIDVTPLFKYEVTGRDSDAFLSNVMTKNIAKMKQYQIAYVCWCDDAGHVIDDGTVTRFDEDKFRVTAAEASLSWFQRMTRGYDVNIEDSTDRIGALALQGPTSRGVLKLASDADMDNLKFFKMTKAKIDDLDVIISRTGYTGDLGYEVWVDSPKGSNNAIKLYDALLSAGKNYGLQPAGLDAMDVTRVEAGFIMNGVDYFSAHQCIIESRKSTPYELGLGWTVNLDREEFIGKEALIREKENGSKWAFVGIEVDWDELEAAYAKHGLPPQLCTEAWRGGVPVYDSDGGRQVGYATSGAWSPILKKYLALCTVEADYQKEGTELRYELTAEYVHHQIKASVRKTPFFNPERKRS